SCEKEVPRMAGLSDSPQVAQEEEVPTSLYKGTILEKVFETWIENLQQARILRRFPQKAVESCVQATWPVFEETIVNLLKDQADIKLNLKIDGVDFVATAVAETFFSHAGIQPYLSVLHTSIATALWTAFEVLACDMWVTCLNERPVPLAQRAMGQQFR